MKDSDIGRDSERPVPIVINPANKHGKYNLSVL